MLSPDIYYIACQHLYSNDGAGTKGVDNDTADGFSEKYVTTILDALKAVTYYPKPVRRTYCQKPNGKMRPLGLPSFSDKLVLEVMRMILEAIYKPLFSYYSHGFRLGRDCHTALSQLSHEFIGAKWFVWGDIKGCFDNIDHSVLIESLEEIKDARFLRFVQMFLRAGFMENSKYHGTYKRCQVGNSPCEQGKELERKGTLGTGDDCKAPQNAGGLSRLALENSSWILRSYFCNGARAANHVHLEVQARL